MSQYAGFRTELWQDVIEDVEFLEVVLGVTSVVFMKDEVHPLRRSSLVEVMNFRLVQGLEEYVKLSQVLLGNVRNRQSDP